MTKGLRGIAAASLMAGLGTGLATSAAAQDISWWYEQATPEQQGFIDTLIVQPFEAAAPDFDVTVDYRGNDVERQVRLALLAGRGPDVVFTPGPAFVAPMAQAGQLKSLDAYAEELGWTERLLPVFLEMGRYDGTLYALPTTYETLGLYYNASLFADNGWEPPSTIAEMEALADKMIEMDIIPFASGNAGWRPANEWMVSLAFNSIAGPEKFHQALTSEIPWTDPAFVEATEALNRWWEAGYFGPNYMSIGDEQRSAMLASRQAGMMPIGTWEFQNTGRYFAESGDEVAFVGFPRPEGAGDPVFPLGVGSTFSISEESESADGAARLIDYIFSTQVYGDMNSVWPGEWNLPLADLSDVEMSDDVQPAYAAAMATLAASVNAGDYGYTTWTFLPPATNTYLWNGIEEIWFDRITVEEYLANLDEQFREEVAEGKLPAIPAR